MRASVSRSSRHGGALILALLFMGVITAGFVTWISLIRQRARVGDFEEHQVRKRLAAGDAEILARDYLLRRALASNGDDDGLTGTSDASTWSTALATSWNGSSQAATSTWTGYALDSSTRLAGLNGFSPTYDYPYSKSFTFTTSYKRLDYNPNDASTNPGTAQYNNDTTTVRGYVRSRNLLLGGDLLVLHRPTPSVSSTLPAVTGNVAVQGRVVHFAPEIAAGFYSARSQRFSAPAQATINVAPANIAGSGQMWSNLAWTPMSTGNTASGNLESAASGDDWRMPEFSGQLNFIDCPAPVSPATSTTANPSNSLRQELIAGGTTLQPAGSHATSFDDSRGLDFNGTGSVTISPCLGSTTSDLPSVILTNANALTEIVINGQSDATTLSYAQFRPAFTVLYSQASGSATNLARIRIRHQNNRRMILAIKKATLSQVEIVVEATVTNPNWHLLVLAENTPILFTYSAGVPSPVITGYPNYLATSLVLYGGIETNSSLTFPASPGLCEINLETDTRGLIRMTPRTAWVETFLNGKL